MENEMKQKKEYVAPEMEELSLDFGACLLHGSDQSEPNEWGGEFD